MRMFICDKCGHCCRHLNLSNLYIDLDRGDGVCKFLEGNLCSIYEERPIKCKIDDCYDLYFKDYMTKAAYYEMNYAMCEELKKEGT